jgi:hypothetical protein
MFWAPGLSPDGDQAILHALCFPAVSWPRCIPSRVGCWDVGMLQWFDSVWLRSSWIPSWIWNHLRYRFTEASGYCKNSDLWTAGSFYSDSLHFAPIAFAWKFRSCKTLQLPRTKLMTSPWHHALDLCLLFVYFVYCLLDRNRCTATVWRGHSCPRCQTSFASNHPMNQRLGFMCLNDISPTNTYHISMFSASMDNISWLYGFSGLR